MKLCVYVLSKECIYTLSLLLENENGSIGYSHGDSENESSYWIPDFRIRQLPLCCNILRNLYIY